MAKVRVLVANRGEIAVRVIRTCRELGIPTVAIYSDADRDALHVEMADEAHRIGPAQASQSYLSIDAIVDAARRSKATHVVRDADHLEESLRRASREAQSYFGRPEVFLERYVDRAHHIEAQIIGDAHGNVVFLGERDCSVQRRHQKLIEETPSPLVDDALRE